MLRNDIPIDAFSLFRVKLDERRAVADLAFGLGERLALLERQQQREVVGVLHDEIEPAAE